MDILGTLFSQGTRKIGMFVPSVVISEKHSDTSEITEHSVQISGKGGFTVSSQTARMTFVSLRTSADV